jgi:hypothetical protein
MSRLNDIDKRARERSVHLYMKDSIEKIIIELPNDKKQNYYTTHINDFQNEILNDIDDLIKQVESERA